MRIPRSAGLLLHVTSLPDGRLGPEARSTLAWIATAGLRWWQVLPICPPGAGGSPYDSPSSFAIDPSVLEDPDASVAPSEARAFREREAYWIDSHLERFGGEALAEQVRCDREWAALRHVASRLGVGLIGDLPIYVSAAGVERAARPFLFREGVVGGVPPDAFTADGQRWGNPVYDWDRMAADGYRWWIERIRRACRLFDVVRLDHFRGFAAYWAIPAIDPTARGGSWVPGPGRALFDAVAAELGELPLIAEDLGVITPDVDALRESLGLPTLRVLQFGFEHDGSPHHPSALPEHCAAYTGTHDNDTLAGWLSTLPEDHRARLSQALAGIGHDGAPTADACVELLLRSPARLCVVPAQDLLALGSDARMNRPGTGAGNWAWRIAPGALDRSLAARLRDCLGRSGRLLADRRPGPGGT